jgi:DNA-binding PadR family transcriptional regulator
LGWLVRRGLKYEDQARTEPLVRHPTEESSFRVFSPSSSRPSRSDPALSSLASPAHWVPWEPSRAPSRAIYSKWDIFMKNMRQGSTSILFLVVLSLLAERPMHPYEIHRWIRYRCMDRVVKVTAGSLYHAVERLHRGGLIQPLETEREGRRPERTIYAITEAGRDRLYEMLERLLAEPTSAYSSFAAALSVMHHLSPETVASLLRRRVLALESHLVAQDRLVTNLLEGGLPRSALVEVEYEQALRRAELEWVQRLIDELEAGRLPWPTHGTWHRFRLVPTEVTMT